MSRLKNTRLWAGCLLVAVASPAAAHMMQVAYNLPVPLWMYAYGATAALVASFVVVAYFVRADSAHVAPSSTATRRTSSRTIAPPVVASLRLISVAVLALAIVSGLIGSRTADTNINMTLFWVAFVLGFTYLTAFVGDLYAFMNPWLVLCQWSARLAPALFRPRLRYPAWLGCWPALLLYMAFIWLELFGHVAPRSLSIALATYTALSIAFACVFGIEDWVRNIEFFALFLRLVAKLAPVEILPVEAGERGARYLLRRPFSALWNDRARHFSELVFVLFMLSSTAFDGVHETLPWVTLYWKHLYPMLATFIGTHDPRQYLVLVDVFYWWQWGSLVLSPFVYLAIYQFFMMLAKWVTRSGLTVTALGVAFAYSLIPIAFVYHFTHYFTLLLAEGPLLVMQLSDPFGFGWNLFHSAGLFVDGILLDAGVIWHTQVWSILVGHIVSVYVAHVQALRIFRTSREATLSQAPVLLLMVALTTIGLWILSMPISAGQVFQPNSVAPG
jgi:hypothetical protein